MKALRLAVGIIAVAALSGRAQNAPDMNTIMQAMGAMLGGGTNAAAIVDFRELKALLPAELPGLKRTNAGGEKSAVMGLTIAQAEGRYEAEGGKNIKIRIQDMGASAAVGGFMAYSWASMEVDRESDTGYERTTTIGGHKAMEKYNTENQSGDLQILVNKRFMVEINGWKVTADEMKAAAQAIDLNKLAGLQAKPAN